MAPTAAQRRDGTGAASPLLVIFGAGIARQCLQDGLLDEIVIHLAPVLLGDGVRLYDSIGTNPIVLRRTAVATTGQLTDMRFRV